MCIRILWVYNGVYIYIYIYIYVHAQTRRIGCTCMWRPDRSASAQQTDWSLTPLLGRAHRNRKWRRIHIELGSIPCAAGGDMSENTSPTAEDVQYALNNPSKAIFLEYTISISLDALKYYPLILVQSWTTWLFESAYGCILWNLQPTSTPHPPGRLRATGRHEATGMGGVKEGHQPGVRQVGQGCLMSPSWHKKSTFFTIY